MRLCLPNLTLPTCALGLNWKASWIRCFPSFLIAPSSRPANPVCFDVQSEKSQLGCIWLLRSSFAWFVNDLGGQIMPLVPQSWSEAPEGWPPHQPSLTSCSNEFQMLCSSGGCYHFLAHPVLLVMKICKAINSMIWAGLKCGGLEFLLPGLPPDIHIAYYTAVSYALKPYAIGPVRQDV